MVDVTLQVGAVIAAASEPHGARRRAGRKTLPARADSASAAFQIGEAMGAVVVRVAHSTRACCVVLASWGARGLSRAVFAGGAFVVRARQAFDANVIRRANARRAHSVRLAARLTNVVGVAILAVGTVVGGVGQAGDAHVGREVAARGHARTILISGATAHRFFAGTGAIVGRWRVRTSIDRHRCVDVRGRRSLGRGTTRTRGQHCKDDDDPSDRPFSHAIAPHPRRLDASVFGSSSYAVFSILGIVKRRRGPHASTIGKPISTASSTRRWYATSLALSRHAPRRLMSAKVSRAPVSKLIVAQKSGT